MVRIKQRYLLFNILYPINAPGLKISGGSTFLYQSPTPEYLDAGRFIGHLRQHISLLFGDLGVGLSVASLKIVYFSNATSTAILRVPRNHHRLVWAALTHINELPSPSRGENGRHCVIRIVRVSGTIRKAEEELVRRTRKDIVKARHAEGQKDVTWASALSIGEASKSRTLPPIGSPSMPVYETNGEEEEEEEEEDDEYV